MADDRGMNDSRDLDTGETVHLYKPPNGKWRIRQYDRSWPDSSGRMFWTKTGYAEKYGWGDREFDTPDDAYAFVADQIRQDPSLHIRPTSTTPS